MILKLTSEQTFNERYSNLQRFKYKIRIIINRAARKNFVLINYKQTNLHIVAFVVTGSHIFKAMVVMKSSLL